MRRSRIPFVSVYTLSAVFMVCGALVDFSPAEQEGYGHLTAPEVKSMTENGKTVLVHVLTPIEFDMQHIPGSINIPIVEMETSDDLPQDLHTPLIFYCMGKR